MVLGLWRPATSTSRRQAAAQQAARTPPQQIAASVPRGVVNVETEIRQALTALQETARRRFVELEMAVEPSLVAKADTNDCQTWLRTLLAAAIDRAESGILVTAIRHGDSVHIEILDDGATEPASIHVPSPHILPPGATVTAENLRGQGVKVSLCLPYPQTDSMGDAHAWTLAAT